LRITLELIARIGNVVIKKQLSTWLNGYFGISQVATIARKGNLVTAACPGDVRAPEMSYGEGSTLTTDFIKMAP